MQRFYRSIALALCALLMISCMTADAAGARADITITERGCTATSFALTPDRGPQIMISNQAAEPMVFSLPVINRWQVIAPSQQVSFDLPRYIMGSFDFFCLTESAHKSIGGGNPFLCLLDPKYLKPVALSSGIFDIEPHNRIQEILHPPVTTAP